MSRFCINCGTELPENAMFCRNCGTKVNDIQKDQSKIIATNSVEANTIVKNEEVKKPIPINEKQLGQESVTSKKAVNVNLLTIIIVAAMILITIIIIAAIIVSGKKTEKELLHSIESNEKKSLNNQDIEDIIEDYDIEDIYREKEKKANKNKSNDSNLDKDSLPQNTIPEGTTQEDNTSENTEPTYNDPEADAGNTSADTSNTGGAQRMTEEEFTLCWFNDPYLDLIPLLGLGTYETIIQSEKYSTAIVSAISREDVMLYCEETGSEGDLDMNGFTVNPKRVADTNEKYAFQVSNKNGVTVYVVWSENVALITVGVE